MLNTVCYVTVTNLNMNIFAVILIDMENTPFLSFTRQELSTESCYAHGRVSNTVPLCVVIRRA